MKAIRIGTIITGLLYGLYAFMFGFEPQFYGIQMGTFKQHTPFNEYVERTASALGDHWYIRTAAILAYPGAYAGGYARNGLLRLTGTSGS